MTWFIIQLEFYPIFAGVYLELMVENGHEVVQQSSHWPMICLSRQGESNHATGTPIIEPPLSCIESLGSPWFYDACIASG